MNIEVKILKKKNTHTHTNKLNPAIYKKNYIPYEVGFIPEMQG